MTPRSPGAFLLSATFHAAIVAFIVLTAMITGRQDTTPPRILELVAGEGDNYGATVAPKLGTPGGLKVDLPAPPTPKAVPITPPEPEPEPAPAPPPPEPPPITKAPPPPNVPPPPPKAPEKKQLTPKQQLLRKVWAAQDKGKKEAAKERAAEEKRLKKEEFDRMQREKKVASAKGGASPKVSHIDAEGIAKGVVGGSAENKVGGAGGKALVADGPVVDRYYALLIERVKNALDKPPGLSDELAVTVEFQISATGRISGVRVTKSSGNDEWDRAVATAFRRVSMPEHPQKKAEVLELVFKTKEE